MRKLRRFLIPCSLISAFIGKSHIFSNICKGRRKRSCSRGISGFWPLQSSSVTGCRQVPLSLCGNQHLTSLRLELHPPEAGGEGGGHQQAACRWRSAARPESPWKECHRGEHQGWGPASPPAAELRGLTQPFCSVRRGANMTLEFNS